MMPSSAQALSTLSDFNSKRQSAQDIYNTANTQYDVTGGQQRASSLKGLVGNLQSSLDAVDPSVTGRTTGNFTTEGQRSALVNREQQPILGNLSKTQSNLGTEESNLSTSQGLASQLASAMISQDQTKYQSLLDQYNAAVAAEAAAEQKRQYEADMAEKQREYNESLAASNAAAKAGGAGGYSLGGGGGGGAATATAQMQQRGDKGFNFQNAAGQGISAAAYSQAKGIPIRTLLSQMASAGDSGAATALQYVGNDYGVNTSKLRNLEVAPVTYSKTLSLLRALGFKV